MKYAVTNNDHQALKTICDNCQLLFGTQLELDPTFIGIKALSYSGVIQAEGAEKRGLDKATYKYGDYTLDISVIYINEETPVQYQIQFFRIVKRRAYRMKAWTQHLGSKVTVMASTAEEVMEKFCNFISRIDYVAEGLNMTTSDLVQQYDLTL